MGTTLTMAGSFGADLVVALLRGCIQSLSSGSMSAPVFRSSGTTLTLGSGSQSTNGGRCEVLLLVAQRFDRIQTAGAAGGVVAEEDSYCRCEEEGHDARQHGDFVLPLGARGQRVDQGHES